MPKYTDSNGNTISEKEVSEGMAVVGITDIASYLEFSGLTLVKENEVVETNASAISENNQAFNGGSTLEDGLSEPKDPFSSYYVTPEDLRNSEENVSPALNKKLSGVIFLSNVFIGGWKHSKKKGRTKKE